ncbi:MAG: hypothetical protein PHU28_02445, partial [Methanosarcinaceae archaeon]|nr:hypothetical protein [Methanosarcinaceae archaeon]
MSTKNKCEIKKLLLALLMASMVFVATAGACSEDNCVDSSTSSSGEPFESGLFSSRINADNYARHTGVV